MSRVCMECGATCAESRSRGWIHTEEIPKTSKSHEAVPVDRDAFLSAKEHEAIQVPILEARRWAEDVRERMLSEELKGVSWADEARHAVVLLSALELAEAELAEAQGIAK